MGKGKVDNVKGKLIVWEWDQNCFRYKLC